MWSSLWNSGSESSAQLQKMCISSFSTGNVCEKDQDEANVASFGEMALMWQVHQFKYSGTKNADTFFREPSKKSDLDKQENGTVSESMDAKKYAEGLKVLLSVLETVHERVSSNEIEVKDPLTDRIILAAIVKFTNHRIANKMLSSLKTLWNGASITRFRSSVVYPLISLEIYCPVVEWVENGDTEVVAFFNIGSRNEYTWLAHYGKLTREKGQRKWDKTYVKFSAETMGYLKVLFEAAEHLGGVLGWDTKDIVRLYCRIPPQEPETNEEYSPCCRLEANLIGFNVRGNSLSIMFAGFKK